MLCSTMCMGPVFALAFVITSTVLSPCNGQLSEIDNGCTCPGDVLTYECTVIGAGFTIWQGTAFHCPTVNSRIELRHSLYSSGTEKSCNEGAIVAHSVGVSSTDAGETSYISRLTVNLTSGSDLNGTTVECVYRRSSDGVETTVGSKTVRVTGAPPPPTGVVLLTAHPQELVFEWTPIKSNCSSLEYGILSDCGTCANKLVTTKMTETCSIVQSLNTAKVCSFTVWTIVCESIYGMASAPLNVTLKVPQAPVFNVTPIYNVTGNKLMELEIEFTKVEQFNIAEGVDGSAVSYSISYIDSNTDNVCESLMLHQSALSCIEDDCTVRRSIEVSSCFKTNGTGLIKVAISATNKLGTGPATVLTIGAINKFVNVKFTSDNKIECVFLTLQDNQNERLLMCNILYGPCLTQQTSGVKATGIPISSNTVTIDLPININSTSTIYCYMINASNGTFTVIMKGKAGTVDHGDDTSHESLIVIISSIVITLVFASISTIFVTVLMTIRIVLRFVHHRGRIDYQRVREEEIPQEVKLLKRHIKFDLLDEHRKLVDALIPIKDNDISIKNIKISSPSAIDTKIQKVTIYIECEEDLEQENMRAIETSGIGLDGSLQVSCSSLVVETSCDVDDDRSKTTLLNLELPEFIVNKPGVLILVLEFIYTFKDWKEIVVTDVTITPPMNRKRRIVVKSAAGIEANELKTSLQSDDNQQRLQNMLTDNNFVQNTKSCIIM